jgi:hypothetical protein
MMRNAGARGGIALASESLLFVRLIKLSAAVNAIVWEMAGEFRLIRVSQLAIGP